MRLRIGASSLLLEASPEIAGCLAPWIKAERPTPPARAFEASRGRGPTGCQFIAVQSDPDSEANVSDGFLGLLRDLPETLSG